jgi:glycosyltransferase involved in cell wall biosynthesis
VKVFTFFYNRYETATTSKALNENGITHNVLIHNADDLQKFVKGNTIHGKVTVTNNNKGLAYQRNTALDMIETGEWAVFMCDDFQKIKAYSKEFILSKTQSIDINYQNQNKYRLKNQITLKEMFNWFPKLIELAEQNNIHLIGFGLHDNPMNLRKKFTTKGLADGRFWLVRKAQYKFDINAQLIDDVAWTAENLVRHKNVLILNWCVPYFERYTAGGFGSTTERKALRMKECAYLANKFNPLVKIAEKPGWDYGTHIRIYGSDGNIAAIRQKRGLL